MTMTLCPPSLIGAQAEELFDEPVELPDGTGGEESLTLVSEDVPQIDQSKAYTTHLTYDTANIVVTVDAQDGVLPQDATVEVEEITPTTAEKADAYGEALASLSETLQTEDKTYSTAKVYDIRLLDKNGVEIEPTGTVQVNLAYKRAQPMGDEADSVEVAHLTDDGDLKIMDANVDTTKTGSVQAAEFATDSFSYYIVFGSCQGSEVEPLNFGEYGWLRFATPDSASDWGYYTNDADIPATNTEEGYHRILKVNLWTLNPSGDESSHDSNNYTCVNEGNQQCFWTWENKIYVGEFYTPGYEVVGTKMHTAWSDPANDVFQDSLVGYYNVRGYRSSDGTTSDLNVLDIYMRDLPEQQDAMRYIIRYVHADGSITDGNVRYLASGDTGDIDVDKARAGEKFSGIAVAAGAEAVTANSAAKTVKFTYDPKVNLAKAYVYFEEDPIENTTRTKDRYDKKDGKYFNGRNAEADGPAGLYADKSAEKVGDREFLVNLEAWYLDKKAGVGLVLDASGSMAWTAGEPVAYELTQEQINSLTSYKPWWNQNKGTSHYDPLDLADVNKLLDIRECDNSNNGYNGYKYYVYTKTIVGTNAIDEYAALGYTDNASGTSSNGLTTGTTTLNGKGKADIVNYSGPGWYFVNSASDPDHYASYGAKRYQGLDPKPKSNANYGYGEDHKGASRFWIQNEGGKFYLYCMFTQGSTTDKSYNNVSPKDLNHQQSKVYIKHDQMMTKAETLQDSIAQFGAILNGASTSNEMAMTRFSHRNFNNLTLLNWTNSSEEIASSMDLIPNAEGGRAKSVAGPSNNPPATYQYGLSGGTVAYKGFKAFLDNYKAYADSKENYKYIILFTDGKDQGPNNTENTGGIVISNETASWYATSYTGNKLNINEAFPDYKIITMFMHSVGMSDEDVAQSRKFLQGLASTRSDGTKLFFEARSDNAREVVEQFRTIAEYVTTGLHDYSVRDYIDPRFDVVNEAGQVLSVLDSNGEFKKATNPDVNDRGFRGFTTPDGKQAQLGYDAHKKQFYVLWQKQRIPGSVIDGDEVNPWQSQIRLVAKQDFLGGNDILTNGQSTSDNMVYKPQMDGNNNPVYDSRTGLEVVDTNERYKSFPFATVNPGLLDVALGNYEDTVFLGENVTPGDLLSTMMGTDALSGKVEDRADVSHRVADTVYNVDTMTALGDTDLSSRYYVEYLERLGKKMHGDKDYFYTLLRQVNLTGANGVEALVEATRISASYTVSESKGLVTITGNPNTDAAGEVIQITKNSSITLTVPYYYLESAMDGSSYAGVDQNGVVNPQNDRVGELTYTWELKDLAHNTSAKDSKNEENSFVEFDTYVDKATHMDTTETVQYQFCISYTPDALTQDAETGDNGSDRTRALIGQAGNSNALIRDAVGGNQVAVEGKQNTTDQMGWAVIHAVDGRIHIEKKMKTADYNFTKAHDLEGTMSFVLTGKGITSAVQDEQVWSADLSLESATPSRVDGEYTYLALDNDWVTGLPQGEYVLTETCTGDLRKAGIAAEAVTFRGEDDPAKPYDDAASKWAAQATTSNGDLHIFVGKVQDGVPASTSYTAGDYTYGTTVSDLLGATPKNIDALLNEGNAKAYLNAQLGHGVVENELIPTSIKVKKVWVGTTEPSVPIVVKLKGSDDTVHYAELGPHNGWEATVGDIPLSNAIYTAEEGTGTVASDGACSDFQPFDDQFVLDGSTYNKISTEYLDQDDTRIETDGITVDHGPFAGTVRLTNGTATITNQYHYMLPAAGGPGVYPFLLVGAFIAAYAFIGEDKGRSIDTIGGD